MVVHVDSPDSPTNRREIIAQSPAVSSHVSASAKWKRDKNWTRIKIEYLGERTILLNVGNGSRSFKIKFSKLWWKAFRSFYDTPWPLGTPGIVYMAYVSWSQMADWSFLSWNLTHFVGHHWKPQGIITISLPISGSWEWNEATGSSGCPFGERVWWQDEVVRPSKCMVHEGACHGALRYHPSIGQHWFNSLTSLFFSG